MKSLFLLLLISFVLITCHKTNCNDGIRNGNETEIDCGGSCMDFCSTCLDEIKNGNEIGIDCGGDCPECTTFEKLLGVWILDSIQTNDVMTYYIDSINYKIDFTSEAASTNKFYSYGSINQSDYPNQHEWWIGTEMVTPACYDPFCDNTPVPVEVLYGQMGIFFFDINRLQLSNEPSFIQSNYVLYFHR